MSPADVTHDSLCESEFHGASAGTTPCGCARRVESSAASSHEWLLDEDGEVDLVYGGDYHAGPKCVRCGLTFCAHCHPERYATACSASGAGLT